MKNTDDRSRWEPAPINGKDVVWSFIMDGLKEEHDIIESPQGQTFATFTADGRLVSGTGYGNHIRICASTVEAVNEVAKWIADPINSEEGNGDLYAETTDDPVEYDSDYNEYICHVSFYHTYCR